MKKFGLIGYPLGHSFSKKYFTEKFEQERLKDHVYELFPMQNISDIEQLLKDNPDLCGLNVTIPHKIGVMFYLDKVHPDAKAIDAVNCIKIVSNKPVESFFTGELSAFKVHMEGYNTDAHGFEASLKPLLKRHHQKALVLGSGGAARAVTFVLEKLRIDYTIVSRKKGRKQISYSELTQDMMNDHLLIINTTPLGQTPDTDACAEIPYSFLGPKHLLYDLVYNPAKTEFLKRGEDRGAAIKNGEEMLHLQAEKAWEIWNS